MVIGPVRRTVEMHIAWSARLSRVGRLFSEVLGTEVLVPESPARIVSFSPAATEPLFLLGLGERIAGVTAFCARPPEARAKRRLGSYNTVREDVLDEIKPDLILTVTGYQREIAVRLSRKFPVYTIELPVSVAGIVDFAVKVGLVVGEPERARALAGGLLQRLGTLPSAPGTRGYVEIDLGGPVTFGAHSYITDAFELFGASQIYRDSRSEWLKPDFAWVREQDPDLIIYEPKMFSEFNREAAVTLVESRGWEGMRAVRLRNIFTTPGPLDFFAHHGPSFIMEAIPWLGEKLLTARGRVGA